jgi:hypothetical protein
MPQRDPGVYLEDIEHYAEAAVRFMAAIASSNTSRMRRPAPLWSECWRSAGRP